jgi:DNA ligase D-like protein (predicted 3'-phosphoesterase)
MSDALKVYQSKRNFAITSEPSEGGTPSPNARAFVIQKHWASRLHYDLRLELDGTMKSWAVPKGPSYDNHDKRMAVQVEDHPISYNTFEGTIPDKQYGAGKVIIWDKGTWEPLGDPAKDYEAGNLKFEMHGHKMHGKWVLVRMKGKGEKRRRNAGQRQGVEAAPAKENRGKKNRDRRRRGQKNRREENRKGQTGRHAFGSSEGSVARDVCTGTGHAGRCTAG